MSTQPSGEHSALLNHADGSCFNPLTASGLQRGEASTNQETIVHLIVYGNGGIAGNGPTTSTAMWDTGTVRPVMHPRVVAGGKHSPGSPHECGLKERRSRHSFCELLGRLSDRDEHRIRDNRQAGSNVSLASTIS